MNYEQKYKDALKWMQGLYSGLHGATKEEAERYFPELKESDDERIRKAILIGLIDCRDAPDMGWTNFGGVSIDKCIDWLEKQCNKIVDCQQNHQDVNYPNGGIVMEDFNGGEGFYKLNLDYLNKKQVEEVEEMVRMWNKKSKTSDENIKNCIGMCLTDANEQRFKDYGTNLKDCLKWLEKQDEQTINHTDIKEKAHQIAWETSKDYDPSLSKESWCEMAALDMASWLEKQGDTNETLSEWSEEDKQIILSIEQVMNCASLLNIVPEKIDNIKSWLKSLRPQKQWKPSEAQLIVIKDLIEDKSTSKVNKVILRGMLREIDDAYLQGVCDAKHEVEKFVEQFK